MLLRWGLKRRTLVSLWVLLAVTDTLQLRRRVRPSHTEQQLQGLQEATLWLSQQAQATRLRLLAMPLQLLLP
jgi:hypothetical protein